MRKAALAAHDPDPGGGFLPDLPGERRQEPPGRVLAGLGLPGRIGNEHAPAVQEGQHAADLDAALQAAQRADVGLAERGVRAEPGHQDPQRPCPGPPSRAAPGRGMLPAEVIEEPVRRPCQRRREGGAEDRPPVAPHREQDELGRVAKVGRDLRRGSGSRGHARREMVPAPGSASHSCTQGWPAAGGPCSLTWTRQARQRPSRSGTPDWPHRAQVPGW